MRQACDRSERVPGSPVSNAAPETKDDYRPFFGRIGRRASLSGERDSDRHVQGAPEGVVIVERLEVRVAAREGAILGIKGNCAFEMGDCLGVLAALGVSDGEHVKRVIVVGIFVANQAKMRNRLVVLAAIDRECGGVKTFLDCLRRRFLRCRVALADVQVQADALVQFLFIRVLAEDRLEQLQRVVVVVALKRLDTLFVESDGLEVGRRSLRPGRCRRLSRSTGAPRPREESGPPAPGGPERRGAGSLISAAVASPWCRGDPERCSYAEKPGGKLIRTISIRSTEGPFVAFERGVHRFRAHPIPTAQAGNRLTPRGFPICGQ